MVAPHLKSDFLKWTVALLCSAVVAVAVFASRRMNHASVQSDPGPMSGELASQLRLGHEKQLSRDWESARTIFQDLQSKLDADPQGSTAAVKEEVARNLLLLEVLVTDETSENVSTEVPPKKALPQKLPDEVFIERYPVGKAITSIGQFRIEGKGHNTAWGLRGAAAFNYLSELTVDTRVIDSDPKSGRLVFEQTFGDVFQTCAVSDRTLELVTPDSWAAKQWSTIADPALRRLSPGYRQFRNSTEIINVVDPGLKRVLTAFSESLRRVGLPLQSDDQVTFVVQVEKLTGTKLRIAYVSGLGVTYISQLAGEHKFDKQELIRLAHASSVMVDHFVMPSLKSGEREAWEVKAADVGSLIALYDPSIELDGSLKLHRAEDVEGGRTARLELDGGAVTARSDSSEQLREGRLVVRNGLVLFDLSEHFIDHAIISFAVQSLLQSRGHLLFGTDQLRDLKVESRYQARLLKSKDTAPTDN